MIEGYLKEERYYNNTTHAQIHESGTLGIDGMSSLHLSSYLNAVTTKHLSIAWVSSGGIVGRGVLLDYCSWATKNSVPLTPFSCASIPFSHIQSVISDQNVSFRPGDILFVRSGFTAAYNALPDSEKLALAKRSRDDFAGVEPTKEIVEWLWESQFAAVAGDSPSFERSPVGKGERDEDEPPEVILHHWLLGGWGMPIGEMFDLEELARHCRENGRWSFFLSSVPLKVSRLLLLNGLCCEAFLTRIGSWWSGKPAKRSCNLLARICKWPLFRYIACTTMA